MLECERWGEMGEKFGQSVRVIEKMRVKERKK